MASILFTCPNTRTTVQTGQHARSLEAVQQGGGRFRCPACNKVHEWTKDSVSLAVGKERVLKDGTISQMRD